MLNHKKLVILFPFLLMVLVIVWLLPSFTYNKVKGSYLAGENNKPESVPPALLSNYKTTLTSDDKTLMIDDTIAKEVLKKVKVFCMITSQEKELKGKLAAVNETWTKRCDGKMFVMTTKQKIPGIMDFNIPDGRRHNSEKTRAAMQYMYSHYLNDFDWFLKADDDTYVVMENLKYLLTHYNSKEPVHLGHLFKKHSKWGFMSGGAGYAISQQALRMLVEKGYNVPGRCRNTITVNEDVVIAHCLQSLGITVSDTRDRYGRETFHPFKVFEHIAGPISGGLIEWDRHTPVKGNDCCSQLLISLHYMSSEMARVIEHLLYRTNVYGRLPHMNGFKDFF